MSFRLRYVPGAYHDQFRSIRYPPTSKPGYPTRDRAEQVRASMPEPTRMEITEDDD